MFQNYLSFTVFATLFILIRLATAKLPESVPSSNEIENIRYADSLSVSPGQCTQIFVSMFCSSDKRKSPVCREKLVLIYLCSLLLAKSYATEPNPGPRPCKYPCGYCKKAVNGQHQEFVVTCNTWFHQECLGMKDCIYTALKNVSWECTTCGLPNFSSALFETTLFETSKSFEPLTHDTTADRDISFSCPQATSSPKISSVRHNGPPEHVSISNSSVRDTTLSGSDNLTHPSFNRSGEPVIIQRSSKQRDDIPLKVLIINCHSILDKKPELENLIETTQQGSKIVLVRSYLRVSQAAGQVNILIFLLKIKFSPCMPINFVMQGKCLFSDISRTAQADIILGTESWLRDDHLSTSIFPKGFKVYRKDRRNRTGSGVFILVTEKLISSEPEEMKVEGSCELIWAHVQVPRSSQLFIGSFYRPPDENDPGYLDQLQSCLSKMPTGAHTWIGGDFNLGDIDWTTDSVKQYANKQGYVTSFSVSQRTISLTNWYLSQQESPRTQLTFWTYSSLITNH